MKNLLASNPAFVWLACGPAARHDILNTRCTTG